MKKKNDYKYIKNDGTKINKFKYDYKKTLTS